MWTGRVRRGPLGVAALALVALGFQASCHGDEVVIPPQPDPMRWANEYVGDGGALLADGTLNDADLNGPHLCTMGDGPAITMRVVNRTGGPVQVFWVDQTCVERLYQNLPAGQQYEQQTFVEHVWRFRGTGGRFISEVELSMSPLEEVVLQ